MNRSPYAAGFLAESAAFALQILLALRCLGPAFGSIDETDLITPAHWACKLMIALAAPATSLRRSLWRIAGVTALTYAAVAFVCVQRASLGLHVIEANVEITLRELSFLEREHGLVEVILTTLLLALFLRRRSLAQPVERAYVTNRRVVGMLFVFICLDWTIRGLRQSDMRIVEVIFRFAELEIARIAGPPSRRHPIRFFVLN